MLLGKGNCSEFAVETHSRNPLFGDTWNPWDTSLTSGGSTGGDSAAVASGMSAFGLGTDFGGSIRWPAHCTGITSLRPTPGLVPETGLLPYVPPADGSIPAPNSMSALHRLGTVAWLARSVDDLGVLLGILAGPDGIDPSTVPVPLDGPVDCGPWPASPRPGSRTRAPSPSGTISWPPSGAPLGFSKASVSPTSARPAAGHRAGSGCLRGPPHGRGDARGRGACRGPRGSAGRQPPQSLLGGAPGTVASSTAGPPRSGMPSGPRSWALWRNTTSCSSRWRACRRRIPGSGASPSAARTFPGPELGSCCRAVSILGCPVAVVPCGLSGEGLPVGVQVVGRPYRDREVLAVAAALERAFGRFSLAVQFPDRRRTEQKWMPPRT